MLRRSRIKSTIEDATTRSGKHFALFIQSLIIISIVSFSIGTLPGLSTATRAVLNTIEIVTVAVFSVEYIVRIVVADSKLRYIFSFFGLIDLAAILPFYIATGLDLRGLRAFRLLRLIRILKLLRYSLAIRRFHRALIIIKEELILFGFIALLMLYLSAVGIYYFERDAQPEHFASVFHSLWWALTTLTTVGYGDTFPVTIGGRVFTFFVLAVGLGIVAVPTGLIASALAQARKEIEDET
jgi:voltage-gated potassium channel